MLIIIRSDYHLKDRHVDVRFQNLIPNYAYYERYLFLKYYFASQQNNLSPGFELPSVSEYRPLVAVNVLIGSYRAYFFFQNFSVLCYYFIPFLFIYLQKS